MNKEHLQHHLRKVLNHFNRIDLFQNQNLPRILCYHRVEPEPRDRWSVSNRAFARQMDFVRAEYHPVSLDEIVAWFKGVKSLPARSIAVTFDDGLEDVYKHAFPILEEANMTATMFVCPGLMPDVNGKEKGMTSEEENPFMSWEQVRVLSSCGWIIGSHSLTHPFLSALNDTEVAVQVTESKSRIEDALQKNCEYFCYPYGTPKAVTVRERELVKEVGYIAALSSITGFVTRKCDLYALPRSKVLAQDDFGMFCGILAGRMDPWRYIETMH